MSAEILRQQIKDPSDRIIVAYDGLGWPEIIETANEVGQFTGYGKTNSAHVRSGADHAVSKLTEAGMLTMLDSKFHDIPQTVGLSVREATLSGASLITVHASGGLAMLKAAKEGRVKGLEDQKDVFKRALSDNLGHILGITVLTSLDSNDCYSIFGIDPTDEDGIKKKVVQFANMALEAGITGVVCSPLEARAIRANANLDPLLVVTPGITPSYAVTAGDQKRTSSPVDAINEGVDLIVVGRGIIKARDYGLNRVQAAQEIALEIAEATR